MRKQRLILAGALLAVVLAAFLWFHNFLASKPPPTLAGQPGADPEQRQYTSAPVVHTTNDLPARPLGMDEQAWQAAIKFHARQKAENGPVNFFARVVDQEDNPVPGAVLTLRLEANHETLDFGRKWDDNRRRGTVTLHSDNTGRLELRGRRGCILYVESLVKEGYIWNTREYLAYQYTPNYMASNAAYADHAQGVELHMWRKAPSERLVPVDWWINLEQENPDGSWVTNYTASLFSGPRGSRDQRQPDIRVQACRYPTGTGDGTYACCFNLEVNGGGLQETRNAYPFASPVGGFHSNYAFTNNPHIPGTAEWVRNFYVKARGGVVYGGLTMEFQGFRLRVRGYLNPSGSRVLEPDPAKLITDPAEIRSIDEATRVK